jgi:ATP-dependent Zn protease
MGKKSEQLKERVAYHEAGHAVMNILLMLPFNMVSIRNIEKKAFQIENGQKVPVIQICTEGVTFPEKRVKSANEDIIAGKLDLREAISNMAGPEAEKIFIGGIDEAAQFGAKNDIQTICVCCRAAISQGKSKESLIVSTMEQSILNGVAMQTNELLKKNWTKVEAVASALNVKRRLSEEDVRQIIIEN